jgi:hypothetical protein
MIVRGGMGFTKSISLIRVRRARHLLYAVVAKNIINSVKQQISSKELVRAFGYDLSLSMSVKKLVATFEFHDIFTVQMIQIVRQLLQTSDT